jgi:hypothetical protein
VVHVPGLSRGNFEHRAVRKVEGVQAVVISAGGMPDRPGAAFCQPAAPGQFEAAVNCARDV